MQCGVVQGGVVRGSVVWCGPGRCGVRRGGARLSRAGRCLLMVDLAALIRGDCYFIMLGAEKSMAGVVAQGISGNVGTT